MAVNIEPSNFLGFQRPFDHPVTTTLKVHNPNSKPIQVKIKTTSPKAYSVRPNFSRVDPGDTIEVQVTLLAMNEDPPINAKCKDKFLVCSAVIPVEKEMMPLTELWNEIQATNKEAIFEQKLKCAYLTSSETIPEHAADQSTMMDSTHYDNAVGSPEPTAAGVAVNGLPKPAQPSQPLPAPPPEVKPAASNSAASQGDVHVGVAGRPSNPRAVTNDKVPAAQISNASSSIASSVDDQLAAARKEIERLTSQLADSPAVTGLRNRTRQLASDSPSVDEVREKTAQVASQVAHTGVPVPTVVLISVAIFLVTYLFF